MGNQGLRILDELERILKSMYCTTVTGRENSSDGLEVIAGIIL